MSYQPPGQYPVFPPQYAGPMGAPPKPPIPPTVQRAFVLMLVGAGLEVVNIIVSFVFASEIEAKVNAQLNTGQTVTNSAGSLVFAAIVGLVSVGLWLWMAFANRAGYNWARITGTVFFGISCLFLLSDIAAIAVVGQWLGSLVVVPVVDAVATFLVGLSTVVLLWRKQSSDYFQPQYPYPMVPGYGMPVPGYMPGAPMQDGAYPPAQPTMTDPWQTPGGQG